MHKKEKEMRSERGEKRLEEGKKRTRAFAPQVVEPKEKIALRRGRNSSTVRRGCKKTMMGE